MKKNVFITGASSGIGAALAREYSRRGDRVALAARRKDRLETLCQELKSRGGEALALECDVTREGDPEKAVAEILRLWGRLDIVVANAGFGVVGQFEDLALEDYRRQFETNLFGLLRTSYASLDALKKSRGSLALLGSVSAYVSLPGATAYSMSKAAVRSLAEGLRFELAPEGVAVTLVSPGFVESEIRQVDNQGKLREGGVDPVPRGLTMKADKAARVIARAIQKRKAEVIVTFHGKVLIWVGRHCPWLFGLLVKVAGLKGRREPGKV